MKLYLAFAISVLVTLSSCLTTLQSLVTPDNIITDDRIDGTWIDSDSKSILIQKFRNSKFKNYFNEVKKEDYTVRDSIFITKLYVVSFREKDLNYIWVAGMVKIKEQYYLNLVPDECLNNNGKDAYDLDGEKTSSIAKLEWKTNNSVVLHFLNGDQIKDIILDGKARIKYEYDPLFGTFVITSSSHEQEQFLEKFGNDERLFNGGKTIAFTHKF